MALFPFFTDIQGADALIVGGGKHALEKAQRLAPFGAALRIIAPQFLPEFEELEQVQLLRRNFTVEDLTPPPAFVILSTDDAEEDRRVAALCWELRIPVNVVDDQPACSFVFPSLITRGSLSIGISTAGASPAAAVQLRKKIESILPDRTEEILDWLQARRGQILQAIPNRKRRFAFHHRLTETCMTLDRPLTEEEFDSMLREETAVHL